MPGGRRPGRLGEPRGVSGCGHGEVRRAGEAEGREVGGAAGSHRGRRGRGPGPASGREEEDDRSQDSERRV